MEDSICVGQYFAISDRTENNRSYSSDIIKSVYKYKLKHICYGWSYRLQKRLKKLISN
jgi:hypothetical protein